MRPLLLTSRAAFVGLALLLAVSRGHAAPRLDASTRDYDQTHLVVRVTPYIEEGRVDGETTVRFVSLVDPLVTLRLHCQETAVLSVTDAEGALQEFSLADDVLFVRLSRPTPKGAEGEVTVRYRSRPTAGLYFHAPSKDCPDTPLQLYSQGQSDDNRRWIPCYDLPDDRATVEVIATVPEGLQTVSGGTLVSSTKAGDGRRRDHWRLDHRVPSYLVTLIVGRYATVTEAWEGVPLDYNGPPGREEEIRNAFASTRDILAFFSDYTGRRYPYPRYAQTTVWDFVYGGMENASATTMNMRLLHPVEARPNYSPDGLVAHEAAHQWFGDIVTCKTWDDLWLNEGFATYFTDLFFEHRDGPAQFALERHFQNKGYMDGTPRPDTLGLVPDPRGKVPLELFGGKQYHRGAAILHQARIELGDEVFRAGVRRYVREHEDRAVASEDLRRSLEAEAGTSLAWFFDQWVYGAGYPVLVAAVHPAGEGSASLRVTVEQTQTGGGGQPDAFRLTVPYRLFVGARTIEGRFDVRRRRQHFDVAVGRLGRDEAVALRLGAGGGTLGRCLVNQDEAAWRLALERDPDPTGRLVAVEALAEWPSSEKVAAALVHAAQRDPVHAVRAQALQTLATLATPVPARAEVLLLALADPDARVREGAAAALGTLTREVAAAPLARAVAKDPSPYVRAAAATSLGRLHAPDAFETLRDLLKVPSHREVLQKGALDGLAALGDRRALPLARAMLSANSCRGDHHGMRRAALDLLLAIAPDEAETHAAIVDLLADPYFRMRQWAAEAAGRFRIASAQAALGRIAERDPDRGARAAATAALARLQGR